MSISESRRVLRRLGKHLIINSYSFVKDVLLFRARSLCLCGNGPTGARAAHSVSLDD